MLHVAVALSTSDSVAILCVLPVLWMTSYFHTMESVGQNQARRYVWQKLAQSLSNSLP